MKRPANPLSYALSDSMRPVFVLLALGTFLHVVGAGDIGFQLAAPALLWIVAIAVLTWFPGGVYEQEQAWRLQVVKKPFAILLIPSPAAVFVSRTIAPAFRPPRFILAA